MFILRHTKAAKFKHLTCIVCVFLFILPLYDYSEAGELQAHKKFVDMANKFMNQKDYLNAEKVLTVAISKYPYAAQFYFMRGKIRQGSIGNYREAILDYSKVVKLKKNIYQPKAYLQRGRCMYQLGMYQQAIYDFTNCLRIKPNYGGRVYFLRAQAFAKLNMNDKAMADLRKVVKFNPGYAKKAQELKSKIMSGNKDF